MKKCPNCNCEIEDNNVFCEYCGSKIKKSNPLWIIVASSVLGVGVGMLISPLKKEVNEPKELPVEIVAPLMSVSATTMNVVYRGVDNPIAVSGAPYGEINASATNGLLTGIGNGIYNLRPGEANEVTINVNAEGHNHCSMKFRVKDLPKPTVFIRNVVNGWASKSALQAAGRVEAELKDFDFDGVHYDVAGYTMLYKTKSGTIKETKAKSGAFTDEIKNVINQANVGDMFLFTAIHVWGSDGKVKTLESEIGVVIK